ncbi:sensor domain-containing diguanylate cyclase [Alteromonas halophila]|uniref:diguanylate cyclase n=1 Tax=Alteromonas halophila TaxID=516698 RepID=A0A918JGR5_9ALTE|nr:diguanylate cyclase [Alteromonas halophila]GGW79267.1 deoxynucleoside kinase [Alteromonas halophila]
MQLSSLDVRRYDVWLVATTCLAFICFVIVALNVLPAKNDGERISDLAYYADPQATQTLPTLSSVPDGEWTSIQNPINLGMDHAPYWFRFTVPPTAESAAHYLLEVSYPLLDEVMVAVFAENMLDPMVTYQSGDGQQFSQRAISHRSLLFPLPDSASPLTIVIRAKTAGTIRLPLRIWKEREFIEHTPKQSLVMGVFFGFLAAMGVSNFFLFVTTRSRSFLAYSGYVFSLGLTLASLHGFGYAYLWSEQAWFQERAVALFANATIVFALIFTRMLLPIKRTMPRMERLLRITIILFAVNIVIGLFLPYAFLIKIFLIMLSVVVMLTLSLGVWLSLKGVVIARYFSIAWAVLLLSGLTASLDNLHIVDLSISSNYLVMLGASIETILLAFVVAISYSHNRDEMFDAQARALTEEKNANRAKEDLLEVQQRYQSDLEYKVEERTLELEITLRELSEVNRELETLNTIDSLTGIKNRRHFDKRLKAEGRRSRREQTPLSLAMIDIDHFKQINDRFGHVAGDACIKHTANVLKDQLRRPSDDVCRIGGEEYALILPNTDNQGARMVVENMRAMLEDTPIEFEGQQIHMTMSAGVATTTIAFEEHELALLKEADRQLYSAKQAGRNQVVAHQLLSE